MCPHSWRDPNDRTKLVKAKTHAKHQGAEVLQPPWAIFKSPFLGRRDRGSKFFSESDKSNGSRRF
jgi:hypothetical protein